MRFLYQNSESISGSIGSQWTTFPIPLELQKILHLLVRLQGPGLNLRRTNGRSAKMPNQPLGPISLIYLVCSVPYHVCTTLLSHTQPTATIAFVHGPQGSGKSSLLNSALQSTGRTSLTIDIKLLNEAQNDGALVGSLAKQTGYWPFFTFWSSASNLVDVASVGLIGQKGIWFKFGQIQTLISGNLSSRFDYLHIGPTPPDPHGCHKCT